MSVRPNVNKVLLTGRLTRDPERTTLPDGTVIAKLRLAGDNPKRQADGSWGSEPVFVDADVFGRRAEALIQHVRKGDPVYVEGQLRWAEWERDGQRHSKLSIRAWNWDFVGGRTDGETKKPSSDAGSDSAW